MALGDLGFTMTPLLQQPTPAGMMGGMPAFSDALSVVQDSPILASLPPSGLGGQGMSAGLSTLPVPEIQMPAGPGIPSMESLPHPTLLDKWAASDRLPTFGLTELEHGARKDAIRAGLMGAGFNMLGSMGPGNQNFMGNLGQGLQAGLGQYQGALSGADAARRADQAAAMQKEKFDFEIGQARKSVLDTKQATEAKFAERNRIIAGLDPEKASLLDPFMRADDKDFYGRLDAITTDEEKDRIIRNIDGKPYEFGQEPGSAAQKIPGVDYTEKPGGEDTMKLSQISSEARALAKAQFEAEVEAQERAREWAGEDANFPETIPANRMDELFQEKLEMLQGMYGSEISRGGGRPTAEGPRETAQGGSSISADIDSIGLPADTAAEFKQIAADLEAQGKSPEEIRAKIKEALQAGG